MIKRKDDRTMRAVTKFYMPVKSHSVSRLPLLIKRCQVNKIIHLEKIT